MGELSGVEPWAWLRRFVAVRFIALFPVIAITLIAAQRGQLAEPSAIVAVVLGAAVANLLLLVVAHRVGDSRPKVQRSCLWGSLLADVIVLALLDGFFGKDFGPIVTLSALPVAACAWVLSERSTLTLAGIASVLVAFAMPSIALGARAVTAALLLALAIFTVWQRRHSRLLEERVEQLEHDRVEREARFERERELDLALAAATTAAEAQPAPPAEFDSAALDPVAEALAQELRDPTGALRAGIERLRFAARSQQDGRDSSAELDRLARASDRVDDARLTLAVLAGRDVAAAPATDVRVVVKEIQRDLEDEFERDGVRLRVEAARRLPEVRGSHNEVRLVLVRLLRSARLAALAANRATRVDLRVRAHADGVLLCVEDALPVPPGLDLVHAFQPTATSKERPALGLALAVARFVSERRGGRVTVEPGGKTGLKVCVVLPGSRAATTNPVVAHEEHGA
ncbi:MAG: sensor histidine kinase [Planctomycetes bacterium]|nr:sensor histidine kinase [Planctomycetota bacterium]MCC7172937.1 sensor histidine kinase [Planctomycetota bacterium]